MASRGKPHRAFIKEAEVQARHGNKGKESSEVILGESRACSAFLQYCNHGAAPADAVLLWHRAIEWKARL